MSLVSTITEDLKTAMKSGDTRARDVLRMVNTAIKKKQIEQKDRGNEMSDEDVITILSSQIKQRRESVSQYESGGREDLAEGEKEEIAVLEKYLPEQLSGDELQLVVRSVIEEVGASDPSDMGKVMGVVMAKVKGQADGNAVREMVTRFLR